MIDPDKIMIPLSIAFWSCWVACAVNTGLFLWLAITLTQ